jgi:hypothetical protein
MMSLAQSTVGELRSARDALDKCIIEADRDAVALQSAIPAAQEAAKTYLALGASFKWPRIPAHVLDIPDDGADHWHGEYTFTGENDFFAREGALQHAAKENARAMKESDRPDSWHLVFALGRMLVDSLSFVCLERGVEEVAAAFHIDYSLKLVRPTATEISHYCKQPTQKQKAVKRGK